MREALTTYTCDAPSCDQTTLMSYDDGLGAGPRDWYHVTAPGALPYELEEVRHLCSTTCLTEYASTRLGAEMGLPPAP